MDNNVVDDVIRGLYEAAAGLLPWPDCLARVHAAVAPAFAVQLLVSDRRSGQLRLAEASPDSPVDVVLEYLREWHRLSPHVAHLAAMPVGELMNSTRQFPPAQYADHPFYRDFWYAYNVGKMLGGKAAQDGQQVAFFGISRALDHPEFSPAEEAFVQRCLQHLSAALRIAASLLPLRSAGIVGLGLMQASARPMLLLDSDLGLMATNRPADSLLARGDTLFLNRGRLQCALPEDFGHLRRALASIAPPPEAAAGNAATPHTRTALRLGGGPAQPLMCSLWHLRPEQTQGAFGPQPAALLTVHADTPVDALWLGAMFDLTPAEATVAAALMSGLDVKQIADANRRSVHTVRSQLRAVLQKTGARRQVDLVQLLLRASSM
jgi:DNA-binding CsgD family transcriptional regulator